MTTELTKAAQQALEALKNARHGRVLEGKSIDDAIYALTHALTQRPAAQEVKLTHPADCRCEWCKGKSAAQTERGAFEAAMKDSWQMVDPFRPPTAGSYYAGEHAGICAALKTVRANFDRHWKARASLPAHQQATPAEEFKTTNCKVNGIDGTAEVRRVDENTVDIGRVVAFADEQATPEPLSDQDAVLLNQAHEILLEHAEDQRNKGNESQALGATCSADAVLRLSASALARPADAPEPVGELPKPAIEIDLGDGDPRTVRIVWSDWDSKANKLLLCLSVRDPEQEPVAWRMRDTGFRKPHYVYFTTKDAAQQHAAHIEQSRDDGHMADLTPLYTRPAPDVPDLTEAMLVAGLKKCEPLGELIDWREDFGREEMRAVWDAMIAAAQAKGGQ